MSDSHRAAAGDLDIPRGRDRDRLFPFERDDADDLGRAEQGRGDRCDQADGDDRERAAGRAGVWVGTKRGPHERPPYIRARQDSNLWPFASGGRALYPAELRAQGVQLSPRPSATLGERMFVRRRTYIVPMARRGSGNEGESAVLAAWRVEAFESSSHSGRDIHMTWRSTWSAPDPASPMQDGMARRGMSGLQHPVYHDCTDHGRGPRSYDGHAELFGVYFRPSAAVYLLPIDAVAATEGRLRLEPTRNNQKLGIRFAADYEIDRWSIESLRGLVSQEGSGADQLAFA